MSDPSKAQVAAALGVTLLSAEILLEAIKSETRRLSARRVKLVSGHADRLHILHSLRRALSLLVEIVEEDYIAGRVR